MSGRHGHSHRSARDPSRSSSRAAPAALTAPTWRELAVLYADVEDQWKALEDAEDSEDGYDLHFTLESGRAMDRDGFWETFFEPINREVRAGTACGAENEAERAHIGRQLVNFVRQLQEQKRIKVSAYDFSVPRVRHAAILLN